MKEASNDWEYFVEGEGNNAVKEAIREVIKLGDDEIGNSKYTRQAWENVKDILRKKYDIEKDMTNYQDIPYQDPVDRDRKRYGG